MWLPPHALSYALLAGLASLLATIVVLRVQVTKNASGATNPAPVEDVCMAFGGVGVLLASVIGVWLSALDAVLAIGAISVAAIYAWDRKRSLLRRWRYSLLTIASGAVVFSNLVFNDLGFPENVVYTLCIALASAWLPYLENRTRLAGGVVFWSGGPLAISAMNAGPIGSDIAALTACLAAGSFTSLFFNFPSSSLSIGKVAAAPIGFLLAVSTLLGISDGVWPVWFALLVFFPPLALAGSLIALPLLRNSGVPVRGPEFAGMQLAGDGSQARQLPVSPHLLMAACAFLALLLEQSAGHVALIVLLAWGILFLLVRLPAKAPPLDS